MGYSGVGDSGTREIMKFDFIRQAVIFQLYATALIVLMLQAADRGVRVRMPIDDQM